MGIDRSSIELPDGRSLAWVEYGPADGHPVLFFHGGNDCGLEAAWFADELDQNIRLIAPDRPGFGYSTFHPGRRFADYAADMTCLADHLEIDMLPAFSMSGGGPHLLAMAALSRRLTRLAVIAGPCPFDVEGFLLGTWFPIRVAYLAARFAPTTVLRALQSAMNNPRRNLQRSQWMPWPDAELLADHPERQARIVESVSVAHQSGFDGAVQEWRLYTRPWGYDLTDIEAPVTLWYGEEDGMAPPHMGAALADQIPGSRFFVLPDEAHLSIIHNHASTIVRELVRH